MKFITPIYLTIFAISLSVNAEDQVGKELRTVRDLKVMGLSYTLSRPDTENLYCYETLGKINGKNTTEVASAGTIFKIVEIKKIATDSFIGELSVHVQGLTQVVLDSESGDLRMNLNCYTKKGYLFKASALSHAPKTETILEIFNNDIN